MSKYFVYILRCSDGSLYTGFTTDIDRRVKEHNGSQRGAKYTQSRRPCVLVYYEELPTKHGALCREAEIKKFSRKNKLRLIQDSKKGF